VIAAFGMHNDKESVRPRPPDDYEPVFVPDVPREDERHAWLPTPLRACAAPERD
jgi:hypothetical protein